MDTIKRYQFDTNSTSLSIIYLHILDMLTVAAQEVYPYHIPNIVSNDELYGSDPKFLTEIDSICSQVVDQILLQLKLLGDANQIRSQCNLALDLFVKIVYSSDVGKEKMFTMASNLWSLAMKNRSSLDPKLPVSRQFKSFYVYCNDKYI